MKNLLALVFFTLQFLSLANAAGRIQNEDIKSLAELVAGGGNVTQLPNDTKVYLTNAGLAEQLSAAIGSGDVFSRVAPPIFGQFLTPPPPAAGFNKCYTKADDRFYCINSAGVETLIGPSAVAGGTPNSFAGYDALGNLYSLPGWGVEVTNGNFGLNSLQTVVIPAAPPGLQKLNTMEWELDAQNSNAGYDSTVFNYDFHYDRSGSGGNAGNISAFSRSATMEGTGTLNSFTGDSSNVSLGVGTNAGTVTSGTIRNMTGSVGAGFTVPTFVGENIGISTDATAIVSDVTGLNKSLSVFGSVTNLSGENSSVNSALASTVNSVVGENKTMNLAGPVTTNVSVVAQDISLNTVGGDITVERRNINSGVITGDVTMDTNSFSGTSGDNFVGKSVSASGAFNSGVAYTANMGGMTLPGGASPVGLSLNSASIQANANIPVLNAFGFQGGQQVVTLTNIANGSPIAGTDFVALSTPGILDVQDNFSAGPLGFNYAATGYVGQLSVGAGFTLDQYNLNVAGASIPVTSTGGTVTEANMYHGFGLFAAGGTATIPRINLLKGSTTMCALATVDCFGVNAPDPAAQGYFGGLLTSETGLALEETGAGLDDILIQAPAAIAAPYTLTLPVDDGLPGEILSTNGSGVLSWASASGVTSSTGYEPEQFNLNGGTSVIDDFDGIRRTENNKSIAKIVACLYNSGISGNTTVRVNFGAALGSNTTLNIPATGGVNCAQSTPASALVTNDLMNVDVTAVAAGAPEDLSVKIIFGP